eukprot:gnl/TRDRNA2_/TRDRNA2_176609_c0_seq3.p1 gnl/TRDRNA2_/TRDRNA2_176609_c0~~gnl/TRDRNA2_/TRDRNA2_176609_c0_seq3.p1  ORF type:complete len:354 (-),score=16.56 gnl/TRDRNA2_/TRDRNA2_176609_c0_seq3:22-1083(-)
MLFEILVLICSCTRVEAFRLTAELEGPNVTVSAYEHEAKEICEKKQLKVRFMKSRQLKPSEHACLKFVAAYREEVSRNKATWEMVIDRSVSRMSLWRDGRRLNNTKVHRDPLDRLKLVIGIMTPINQPLLRQIHRDTWMQHDGVCPLSMRMNDTCHTFPVFLYANHSLEALPDTDRHDAIILTDVPEDADLRSGYREPDSSENETPGMRASSFLKTPSWMRYAQHQFPWATHIVKMDMDTYPFIRQIQNQLVAVPQDLKRMYFGQAAEGGYAPGGVMMGGFYGVTSDLVDCWVRREALGKLENGRNTSFQWAKHNEDQVFSDVLQSAEESNMCPTGRLTWCGLGNGNFHRHPM